MFNYTIPLWLQSLIPYLTWKVKTNRRVVYFTFDDGPHPSITPWVMEQLDRYNAKATFFCVGENIKKFPETYQILVDNGHSIGNHTFNHLNGWKTGTKDYLENVKKFDQVAKTRFFRPPYGRIKPAQIWGMRKDYQIIMWDILTGDYNRKLNPEVMFHKVSGHIKPGSVVLLHDSEKAEPSLKIILPLLLEYCKQKDFTFEKF